MTDMSQTIHYRVINIFLRRFLVILIYLETNFVAIAICYSPLLALCCMQLFATGYCDHSYACKHLIALYSRYCTHANKMKMHLLTINFKASELNPPFTKTPYKIHPTSLVTLSKMNA